jgi:hypothetical protein
VAEVPG